MITTIGITSIIILVVFAVAAVAISPDRDDVQSEQLLVGPDGKGGLSASPRTKGPRIVPDVLPPNLRVRLRDPGLQTAGIWLIESHYEPSDPLRLGASIRYSLVRPLGVGIQGQRLAEVRREDIEIVPVDLSRGRR